MDHQTGPGVLHEQCEGAQGENPTQPCCLGCSWKLPCREYTDTGSSNLLSLGRAWPGVRIKPQGLPALLEPWASGILSSR